MNDPSPSKPGPKKIVATDGHEYHKSATANADTAPTNEATTSNADMGGGLTEEQLNFVTIVHYEVGLKEGLPSKTYLCDEYHYSENDVMRLYSEDKVIAALQERGIEMTPKQVAPVGLAINEKPKPLPKLTPLQLIVANRMLDLADTRSEKKKLSDLGVTTLKYQSWLRDPDFSGYLRERVENMIGDVQHEAMVSLMDNVRAGRTDAIKYYHELIGRFVPQGNSTGGTTAYDMQQIIVRIIEIISDEVDDPQIAARIGDRLKALVVGNQVAGIIPPEPVKVPEVAKPREQTPEVQALMQKGMGYDS